MEAANLLHKEYTIRQKGMKSIGKGKRQLRNLIFSVNYDGR